MEASFKSFAFGFLISFLLLFLILTAQFKSFIDPFLIMLAIPMGFVGVLIILPLTGSTLNVMSLMGVSDAGGHRGLEQHSDRRFRPQPGEARTCRRWMPSSPLAACACAPS